MGVTTERLPRSLVALEIEVDDERLEAQMDKAVRRLSQRVRIPGFRPGKAPRQVVERTLGRPALLQEALEELLPDVYNEAIESQDIQAIGQPEFDLKSTEPLVVSATVPVRPTIDLRDGRFSSLGDPVTYWDRTFTSSWTDPRTVAIAFGTTIENAVGGMAGDTLTGNASVNVLMGRDGDDTLAGGGGDDVVDGGNGTDTAVLGAASAGATVTSGGGRFRVTAGTEGSDTLVSIEKLQFTDKAFTLSNPALDHVP